MDSILLLIVKSLYFFLPAYFANMSPILLRWVPFLDRPVQKKYFGKNKTWRGIVAAILTGTIIFSLQKLAFYLGFTSWALIDYADYPIFLGFLLGAGAICGDLVKSYYKRRMKIPPGVSWIPWDQLDFVFGGIIFSFLVFVPPAEIIFFLLIFSPLLHIAANFIGYWLGINKRRW